MRREEKILVVEDNPAIARAIEAAGEAFCVKCDCATDGWDAISKLETEDYAAILIDADVPRQSGYGVLTYLREEVGNDLLGHVIMMTSSDRAEVSRRAGGIRVVAKADAVAEITKFCQETE